MTLDLGIMGLALLLSYVAHIVARVYLVYYQAFEYGLFAFR